MAGKAHFTERNGPVSVPIYRQPTRTGVVFVVSKALPQGGRERKAFADFEAAKAHAKRVARTILERGSAVSTLSDDETSALALLRSTATARGVTLRAAILDAEAAMAVLGGQTTLRAAAEAVVAAGARETLSGHRVSVAEAVGEFLRDKETSGRSSRHLRDLSSRLSRLAREYVGSVSTLTPTMIRQWVGGIPGLGPRSRNNFLSAVCSLVSYCVRRGWLVPDQCDTSRIDRWTTAPGEIEVFTPEELQLLLRHADDRILAWIVLGAWTGLRAAEIARLRWKDIRWEGEADAQWGYVEVPAGASKNAAKLRGRARRLIPMTKALRVALIRLRSQDPMERIVAYKWPNRLAAMVARKAGVEWKANGLRHSFGSYRLALTQNENQVAMEMGNSPQVIFAHYRRVVNKLSATGWFDVPPSDGECPTVGSTVGA